MVKSSNIAKKCQILQHLFLVACDKICVIMLLIKGKLRPMQFKKNDSGFVCLNCNRQVTPLQYSSRNHCPFCLASKHVDVFPGDRAHECGGVMLAVAAKPYSKGGYTITHKCTKCGEIKNNISANDDSLDTILHVVKQMHKTNF